MGNAFMGDGPIMSGHWYNPKSGDSFTVRDTYFEDNNLIVMTTDGRRLDYNMIQQYVQTDKPMPKRPVDDMQPSNIGISSDLPPEIASILAEDTGLTQQANLIQQPIAPVATVNTVVAPVAAPAPVEDEDDVMVRRMLKRGAVPSLDIKIKWPKYPTKQMEMLVEYMGVDIEKIANFYISQLSLEDIRKDIEEQISQFICASQIAEAEVKGNVYTAPKTVVEQKPVEENKPAVEQKPVVVKKVPTKKPVKKAVKKAPAKKPVTKKK